MTEIIIGEDELEDLLEEAKGEPVEEAKGESTELVVEIEKEEGGEVGIELELEPENQKESEVELEKEIKKEDEEIELEVEEPKVEEKGVAEPEVITAHETKQTQQTQSLQPLAQTGLVAPVCSVQESVRIFKEFEQAKRKILSGNDILWMGSDGKPAIEGQGSPHIKRSGWRKLARFFGLSWDIENIEKLSMEHGGYMYKVRVKVWHPAGASVISEGVATSRDIFFTKGGRKSADEENVLMKAQTVAVNRAISDILGSGEVSGEETE